MGYVTLYYDKRRDIVDENVASPKGKERYCHLDSSAILRPMSLGQAAAEIKRRLSGMACSVSCCGDELIVCFGLCIVEFEI